MNDKAMLLGLSFTSVGVLLILWVCRHMSAGPRRVIVGLGAVVVLIPLSFLASSKIAARFTSGRYVCLECGGIEQRQYFDRWLRASVVVDDASRYRSRFPSAAREHEHVWELEGCLLREPETLENYGIHCAGWFRALPELCDRASADALVLESQALPLPARHGLLREVDREVWARHEFGGVDLDQAFVKWLAQRRK